MGKSWRKCTNGLPDGPKTGRIGVAVSYSDPDKAYALIDNHNAKRNYYSEFYITTDGGESWDRTHENDINIAAGLGWYFSDCYVNPQNDDEIYGLGVNIAHSSDAGKSFDLIWKVIVLLAIASLLDWLIIPKASDVLNTLMLG